MLIEPSSDAFGSSYSDSLQLLNSTHTGLSKTNLSPLDRSDPLASTTFAWANSSSLEPLTLAAFEESLNSLTTSLTGTGIQGTKWHDLNGNGIQDTGEPGLAGWKIYLDQNNNGSLDPDETFTLTDANGNYTFTDLEPGTYTVAEEQRPGWLQTYPVSTSNGGFETGNLTGWDTLGSTTVQTTFSGIDPTEGTYQAVISNGLSSVTDTALESFLGLSTGALDGLGNGNATEGSAIKLTSVTVEAGTTLTFDWNFLTNEGTPSSFNDFAFVSIDGATELADTNSTFIIPPGSVKQTGYQQFSYTFTTAGTYNIGLGVVDVGDTAFDSTLLIDNFSLGNASQEVTVGAGQTVTNVNFGAKALSILAESNDTIPLAFNAVFPADSNMYQDSGFIGDNPNLDPNLDVDFVKVELDAGEQLTIDIDASEIGSTLDSVIRVFDAAGNQVAINDDLPAPGELFTLDSYLKFTAAATGTYYVGISGVKNTSYNPLVEGSGAPSNPPGRTGSYDIEMKILPSAGPVSDPLGDTFGFGLYKPDITNINGTVSGSNVVLTMDFLTPVIAPSTKSPLATVGYIDLDLDQNPLTGTPSLQSIFAPPNQKGGPLGSEAYINLFSEQFHPGFVEVISTTTYQSLGLAAISYGLNSMQITLPLSLLGDDGSLSYSAVVGTASEATDAAPDNKVGAVATIGANTSGVLNEPNDTITQAIPVGALIPGSGDSFNGPGIIGDNPNLAPGLDVDFIKVELSEGDQLKVDLDTLGLKSSLDSYLRLFDSAGNQVAFSDDDAAPGETASLDSFLKFTALTEGTYYLAVSGAGNSTYNPTVEGSGTLGTTGRYNIDINIAPDPKAPQAVYLDFVSDQNPGEYVYTAAEQQAILENLEEDYKDFNVTFTLTKPTKGKYSTLTFNAGDPGGLAEDIDFRNLNRSDNAVINISILDGYLPMTSENVVAGSSTIAAHELGHLLGLRHGDSYGPIGSGIHNPPFIYFPSYPGPTDANETTDHIMASPASVGSTVADLAGDAFFGEREAVKLTFNEQGTVVSEQDGSHDSIDTAQALTLAPLDVPNTLVSGENADAEFQVQAISVTGSLKETGEEDFYSFEGKAGEIFNFEVISSVVNRLAADSIDSQISIFDSEGNLVPYYTSTAFNDDEFESYDSILIDLVLPEDDTYYIKVNAYSPEDTGDYELFFYQFAATDSGDGSSISASSLTGGSSAHQFAVVNSTSNPGKSSESSRLPASNPLSVASASNGCFCGTCLGLSGTGTKSGMLGSFDWGALIAA